MRVIYWLVSAITMVAAALQISKVASGHLMSKDFQIYTLILLMAWVGVSEGIFLYATRRHQ